MSKKFRASNSGKMLGVAITCQLATMAVGILASLDGDVTGAEAAVITAIGLASIVAILMAGWALWNEE